MDLKKQPLSNHTVQLYSKTFAHCCDVIRTLGHKKDSRKRPDVSKQNMKEVVKERSTSQKVPAQRVFYVSVHAV